MATTSVTAQTGKASTLKKTFSRETSITIDIKSDPSIIWALLTNAADFPRWNSTVISIEGNIAPGEKIILTAALDPKRRFKLRVKEFIPEKKLAWGDAMGTRIYSIHQNADGTTRFSMTEKIGGPFFPLFAKMIPSFDKSFEQFAANLKKEAELIIHAK